MNIHDPIISGSLVAPQITGSLFGTSSWANNVISASWALNAGNAISSSYILNAISSSYALTALTSSWALNAGNAITASYAISTEGGLSGGVSNFIAVWDGTNTLITSSIFTSGSSVAINRTVFDPINPSTLLVFHSNPTSVNAIKITGSINNYLQVNVHNRNNGINASSDIVTTNDLGTETTYYTDMGINNSSFGGSVGGPNDGYLYHTGSHLFIGNLTPNRNLYLFTSATSSSEIVISGSTGFIGINKDAPRVPLDIIGNTLISGTLGISGSTTVNGNTIISGSFIVSNSIFSRGITIADYNTGITTNQSYFSWRAPFSCSVVAIYGRRDGGSSAAVNARRSGSGGFLAHTGSNLILGTANVWSQALVITNPLYAPGDSLEILISGSGGSPNQVAVQVDFIKLL